MNTKHCLLLLVSAAFAQYAPPAAYPPSGEFPPPAAYPPSGEFPPPAAYPPSGEFPPPGAYPPPGQFERPSLPILMSNLVGSLVESSPDKAEFYKLFSREFVCRVNGVVSKKSVEKCRHLRNPERFVQSLKDVKNPVDYLKGHGFTFEANSFTGQTIFITVLAEKDFFKIVSFDEFRQFDFFGGY